MASTSTADLDRMTDAYDEVFVLDNQLTLEWYPHRVMAAAKGTSLLELGLGHGKSTERFAQHFARYVVIEGSAAMIKRFRERFELPKVDIREGYFETFKTDERFDNIGMGFVLEHVDDPAAVLQHYRQFLKPGGSVFIAVPNAESLHRRLGHAAGLLPDMTTLSEADARFGHQRYFSMKTLTSLVEQCGYEVVMREGILLKPVTTDQLLKLNLSPEIHQALLKVGVDYPELSNSLLIQVRPKAGR